MSVTVAQLCVIKQQQQVRRTTNCSTFGIVTGATANFAPLFAFEETDIEPSEVSSVETTARGFSSIEMVCRPYGTNHHNDNIVVITPSEALPDMVIVTDTTA